jgi:O-antigen biosynthesis alpha-1,2-mannosyltransferase
MSSRFNLRSVSGQLQRYPLAWRTAIRLYGYNALNQKRMYYRFYEPRAGLVDLPRDNYRLVFDGQCLQTLTRQRGIGKYSINLVRAISQQLPEEHFAIVLTDIANPGEIESALQIIKTVECSNLDVLVFNPFKKSQRIKYSIALVKYREYLESLGSDWVLSLSNFEKLSHAIPTPKSTKYKKASILYDLIPLQYPRQLLISRRQKSSYALALDNLRASDLLLSISEESRKYWLKLINKAQYIKVVYGSGNSDISDHESVGLDTKTGFLCVAAEMPHKNVVRLIEGYSLIKPELRSAHTLTIAGIRSPGSRARLKKIASGLEVEIILPDYITDIELKNIYRASRLLVMPSLVEGLSLPILEAWSNGTVAIGSRGTVAEELIGDSSLLFDPEDPVDIARVMVEYLTHNELWNGAHSNIEAALKRFTWQNTAKLTLDALEDFPRG